MTQIPVVLGLTALVAVPSAVGIHFLSTSKTTQTQEVPEQDQPQQRDVNQQEAAVRPPVEETTYDFSGVDVEATDLVGEETEVPRVPSQGSQPSGNQDSDYPPLSPSQLKHPTLTTDLMDALKGQSDSIGLKFKDHLLTNPKDSQWIYKTKLWAKKFVNEDTKDSLTSIFMTSEPINNRSPWSKISVIGLQSRCTKAYARTTWDTSKLKVDRNNYWNTVKELCGRNDQEFPADWNKA